MDIVLQHFNAEWRVGDVLTSLYLLATIGIFVETLRALRINERSLQEMKATRLAGERPAFENTFFNMMSLHHELVRGIITHERESSGSIYGGMATTVVQHSGRRVLSGIAYRVVQAIMHNQKEHPASSPRDTIRSSYDVHFRRNSGFLSHYLRNLYNIVKYVDARAPTGDTQTYIGIVRAQLSNGELVLLFYNCLTDRGDRFKALIEKHGIFEHFPDDQLASPTHKAFYAPGAFGL